MKTLLPFAIVALFLAGCTMGGKVQNEGTLAQQVKSDTSTALVGVETYKGPTPNSVTYNLRVGKGGSCTIPAVSPVVCGDVAVERRIEKELSDETKARAKGWNKITEVDGFYYLLIGIAVVLVGGTIVFLIHGSSVAKATDKLGGDVIGFIGSKLENVDKTNPAWENLKDVKNYIADYLKG